MPRAVILTALPVEYLAVQSHLSNLKEEMHAQGTIYERGKFASNGQEWEVGIVETGAGNAGAALEAERAIAYFKPDILFFVGIAGGIKDVVIGDVVAATKVYGYESGKVGEQFSTRPAVGQSAYALVQRARSEARKEEWLQRLRNLTTQPRVFIAPIAAGEKVVASRESDLFQFLRTSYNDAVAVEMEGFGFLSAAFAYPEIKAIVIRGISDLIKDKNEDFPESARVPDQIRQERASYHASAFAFEILAKLQIEETSKPFSPQSTLLLHLPKSDQTMNSASTPPKVFISYSHDSQEHKERILALADRLRADGIDSNIDQYEDSPSEGWQRWMLNQVEASDYTLIVCSQQYERRFRGHEDVGKGKGATWEGGIVIQELYDAQSKNLKFIPVTFTSQDSGFIPSPLRSATYYRLDSEDGYELLYRRLTNQSLTRKPNLGKLRSLPSRERKQLFQEEPSYRLSQPEPKPAYLIEEHTFRLMPLDIGTIWGLQRSSFIGLLIGFKETKIYENLKNTEVALSNAKKSNKSVPDLPKREWIQIDINRYPSVPYQKSQIIDAAIDKISSEVANSLENDYFLDSSILGFFFEIDVEQLHSSYSEKVRDWCEALLNQLFPSQGIAIVINIIRTLDEDVVQSVKMLKSKLQEIAEEIPIELMCLDARLFFKTNLSPQKTEHTNFVYTENNLGLAFCGWMYWIYHNLNLDLEKRGEDYKEINNLYIKTKAQRHYSETDLKAICSEIMPRDVVLDIKVIAPKIGEIYYQLLYLILNFFPHRICEWVSVYAKSAIGEAVCASLSIAANADLLSDILMDSWVDSINIDTFNIDEMMTPYFENIENTKNIKLESLFLALLRKEQEQSNQKIQTVLQEIVNRYPYFQGLYHFCKNQNEKEDDFLNQNDPVQFTLAVRAKVRFERVINQFKTTPVSHLSTAICWLLAAMPPSQKNITELLQLEPKKRAVFGLCTVQEWQKVKQRQERERQVLDCRRDRLLIFTLTHL